MPPSPPPPISPAFVFPKFFFQTISCHLGVNDDIDETCCAHDLTFQTLSTYTNKRMVQSIQQRPL